MAINLLMLVTPLHTELSRGPFRPWYRRMPQGTWGNVVLPVSQRKCVLPSGRATLAVEHSEHHDRFHFPDALQTTRADTSSMAQVIVGCSQKGSHRSRAMRAKWEHPT